MSKKTQTKGLKRDETDKYYTNPKIVDICLSIFREEIHLEPTDFILEPSAGNGSFIPGIKEMCGNHLFGDLIPEHEEVVEQDFFKFDFRPYQAKFNRIHVIGNPPFGRQSSLARNFIKKACQFADTISFILPKSFKKDSMKATFPLNFHMAIDFELPKNSFLVNSVEYDVPCTFQIWIKKDELRPDITKIEPVGFKFVKKEENPDVAVRRVGGTAGTLDIESGDKSPSTHYFIKFDHLLTDEEFHALSNILFDVRTHTVGPRSISKPELIREYNRILT